MDDIKEAENIGLVYDTVMAYLIKNHAKELFVLTHPLCPFRMQTFSQDDGHDQRYPI
jgi:hypothetical protein